MTSGSTGNCLFAFARSERVAKVHNITLGRCAGRKEDSNEGTITTAADTLINWDEIKRLQPGAGPLVAFETSRLTN
jgi:hypothetical protein